MKTKLFVSFLLGLGLTLALLWLLGGTRLPVRAVALTVTTGDDELNSDGDCSLREAIQAANTDAVVDGCPAGSGADTIILPAGRYTLTIGGSNEDANATGDLDITATLTIVGAGPGQTIINGNHVDRVFDIRYNVDEVVISGVTVFDGYAYWNAGGGIRNLSADLTLVNTVVISNMAHAPSWSSAPGGGVAHFQGALTLTNVSILSNTATGQGGGLYIRGNSAVLSDTVIKDNSVTGQGSDKGGGGLYVRGTPVALHGGQVVSNTSEYAGGGIYIREGGALTQTGDTLIAYNTASASNGSGGGVYVRESGSSITLGAAQIFSNSARSGGGVALDGGSAVLSGTRVSENHDIVVGGGGIRVGSIGRVALYNVQIISNTSAGSGGGICNHGAVLADLVTLSGNGADRDGGGVYNSGAITITNSTLSGNWATNPGSDGGALTNSGGTAVLIYTTIVSNSADRCSGGICVYNNGVVWLQNSIIAYNLNRGVISNCYTSPTSGGYITSTGHNLEDADSCGLDAGGDITNSDPLLGPLTQEGNTWVHPLLLGSPAGEAGLCLAGITTDQRGVARPQGVGCDIGAYEAEWAGLADLVLAKRVTPVIALPGETITYTLSFSNTGSATATGVLITDSVPVSVTNPVVSSSGAAITQAGSAPNFVWQVADLAGGQGGVITITGVLSEPLAAGTLTNTATITTTATEIYTDDNSSATATTVRNAAPIAEAGTPQTVNPGDGVQLDGSASRDPNGDALTYGWKQTGGSPVTLSSATAVSPTFAAPSTAGVLTFTLTVTDTGGLTATAITTITVEDYRIYLPLVLKNY